MEEKTNSTKSSNHKAWKFIAGILILLALLAIHHRPIASRYNAWRSHTGSQTQQDSLSESEINELQQVRAEIVEWQANNEDPRLEEALAKLVSDSKLASRSRADLKKFYKEIETYILATRRPGLDDKALKLAHQFVLAVSHRNSQLAQEFLEKYDKIEKAYNEKMDEDYAKRSAEWQEKNEGDYPEPKFQMCASSYFHEIVCEMREDWDGAFQYLEEYAKYNDKPYQRMDYDIADVNSIKARIHYKMGDTTQAFIDYCNLASTMDHHRRPLLLKNDYSLSQYHAGGITAPATIVATMSPFVSYHDFLSFMEDEFAKTESSNEYREAMEFYRSLVTEEDDVNKPLPRTQETKDASTDPGEGV